MQKFANSFVDGFFVFYDHELVSSIMQLFEVFPTQIKEKDLLFSDDKPFDARDEEDLDSLVNTIFFGK